MKSAGLANFLCAIANKSQRPQSLLRTASTGIGHPYKAKGFEKPVQDESLLTTINNSSRKKRNRMSHDKVQSNAWRKFSRTFPCLDGKPNSSSENCHYLAITLMLRPSDIAPNGVIFFIVVRALPFLHCFFVCLFVCLGFIVP